MTTLTADKAARTITAAPLLPWGQEGRTNLGRVTAARGAVTIPEDVSGIVLNLQHDRNAPLARAVSVTDEPDGLRAVFHVAATRAGDDLLAEVAEGLRTGVSVELDDPVIRAGRLLAGTLTGAGAVVDPAFPGAQLVAADAGDLPEAESDEDDDTEETTDDDPSSDEPADAGEEGDTMSKPIAAPAAPNENDTKADENATETEPLKAALPESLRRGANPTKAKDNDELGGRTLFAALAAANPGEREGIKARLNAALDQAIATDLAPATVRQWLGEVDAKLTYEYRYANLINHDNLTTAGQAIGFRFKSGKAPQVAPYAGFPAQPNSNEVQFEAVTMDSARLAGAGELDRKFIDFPVPEAWTAYYRESGNDYRRKLDGIVLAALIAGATAVEGGDVPTGVATGAAYLLDGALAVVAAERALPSWAVFGADLWRDVALTKTQDIVAFLSGTIGVAEGDLAGFQVRPSFDPALTGKVLVGARSAATLFEAPGASPIRVDTVNIANGSIATGVFGYHAELINDAASLALVAAPVGG